MHSKDGVDIVYVHPASFQIQNGGCVIRVCTLYSKMAAKKLFFCLHVN